MLGDIITWLKERGPASLTELSIHFSIELPAIEGMLQTLEQKGRVERIVAPSNTCATCKGCTTHLASDRIFYKAL